MENTVCIDKTKDNHITNPFLEVLSSMRTGYVLVMATDRFELFSVNDDNNKNAFLNDWIGNALEIRMFNDAVEHKWFRGSIDKVFSYRKIEDDAQMNPMDYWDEYQYLDIDLQASKGMPGNMVCATGGGVYFLPMLSQNDNKEDRIKDTMIQIRNYLGYEKETGQLFISDWRIVKLGREDEIKEKQKSEIMQHGLFELVLKDEIKED